MNTILYLAIAGSGISILTVIFFLEYRKKLDEWSGVLIDKKIKSYIYKGKTRKIFILIFKKDSGKKITYHSEEDFYHSITIGDRVLKNKREYYPVILEKHSKGLKD